MRGSICLNGYPGCQLNDPHRHEVEYAHAEKLGTALGIAAGEQINAVAANTALSALSARVEALTFLLRRAEGWVGIEVDVDADKQEYDMVDKLREDIRAALDGKPEAPR